MGASGCSVGPGPSWVVCAKAPNDSRPEKAKSKIANLAASLFFILTSRPTTFRKYISAKSPIRRLATAMPKAGFSGPTTSLFSVAKQSREVKETGNSDRVGRPRPTVVVFGHLSPLHPFRIHAVKPMHTFLLSDAIPAARITTRSEISLYCLADRDILDLNLIAEFHRGFCGG